MADTVNLRLRDAMSTERSLREVMSEPAASANAA